MDTLKERFFTDGLDALGAEVNFLLEHLGAILDLLKESKSGGVEGETFRHCVREIKTLSYDIEDVREYYNLKQTLARNKMSLAILRDYYLAGRQVKSETRRLRGRYTKLSEGLESYGKLSTIKDQVLRPLVSSEVEGNKRLQQMDFSVTLDNFVGMQKDIRTLVSHLLNEDRNYRAISLYGVRGSGKTALANKLFHHRRIQEHFQGFAWVRLSHTFHTNIVLQDILEQLLNGKSTEEVAAEMEDSELTQMLNSVQQKKKSSGVLQPTELARMLYEVQHKRRCLVVLDDIRSSDAWEILKISFSFAETTTRVMLTTHVTQVRETVAEQAYIHTMNSLTPNKSWRLFKNKACPNPAPDSLVDGMREAMGKELVGRCGGVPLAINVLAALMASKETSHELETVYQNFASDGSRGEITVAQVLASCFTDLPYPLKSCFLYLCYFPEGLVMEVEKLYGLWMAEGMLAPGNLRREGPVMNIADDYLGKLHSRGLVEVKEEVTSLRRFRSCRIDGRMREVCLSKAKEEEFLEVIDYGLQNRGITDSFPFDSLNQLRRLVIYLDKCKDRRSVPLTRETPKKIKGHGKWLPTSLRSLLVYNTHENKIRPVLPDEISDLSHVRMLRVLDFDGVDLKLLRGISGLELLRYLSFKGCVLNVLPEEFGKLPSLQILDLRVRCEITIPNVLWKIATLRHLYLPEKFRTSDRCKLRLDSLIELETLKQFSAKMCNVEHLPKLTNLRYLAAKTERNVEDIKGLIDAMNTARNQTLYSSIEVRNFDCYTEEKHSIFRQLLFCNALHTLSMEGQIRHIPSLDKISENLEEIIFSGSLLMEDPMLVLGKLPDLRVLVLKDDAFEGEDMECTASGFPRLKRLEISNLHSLKKLMIKQDALKELSTLTFENCRRLETIPDGLELVTHLAELNIRNMPKAFEQSISKWKEERAHQVRINYCTTADVWFN